MALMVSRVAKILPELVLPDRCEFVPGSGMQGCINKVILMIEDSERRCTTLGLASLDAEKASDRVE